MDELIYVEVLDRHGEALVRHGVRSLPIRIGRAYDNDVILEDPYVAAHHAVVERSPAGDLELADAGSRNGLYRAGAKRKLGRERVDPAARYRAGRTQFRIRTAGHSVVPELVDRAGARRDWAVALVAMLVAVFAVLLCVWSETHQRTELAKLVAFPVLVVLAIFVWAGSWGLAGRLLVGERRFGAHLAIASLVALGLFGVASADYLAFALSLPGLLQLVVPAMGAVLAWGVWRHLALATRNAGRGAIVASVAIGAAIAGAVALVVHLERAEDPHAMAYLKAIKMPAARLASGSPPAAFFRDAGKLQAELEVLKRQ